MTFVDLPISPLWLDLVQWGKDHYRDRIFAKETLIPTRPGPLYLVHQGVVRLVSQTTFPPPAPPDTATAALVGLLGIGQPFEIVAHPHFALSAQAHVEGTAVFWLYWNELQQWQALYQLILEQFKAQHRQQLLWLGILGQKSTVHRLLNFLILWGRSMGESPSQDYYLPYPLTHAQLGQAVGSTRVTVTRLLARLRQQGLVWQNENNRLCFNYPGLQSLLTA